MVRRRKHHGKRRSFGLSLSPGKILRENVSIKDAAFGGVVGIAGSLGALYAFNKINASRATAGQTPIGVTVTTVNGVSTTTQATWVQFLPAIGGLAIGIAGFMAMKKNRKRAAAILGGATLGGLLITGFNYIKSNYSSSFGDYVRVRLAGMGNVLVHQGAMGNLLLATPVTRAAGPGQFRSGMNGYGRASMGQLHSAAMSPAARMNGYLRARY